MFGNDLTSVWAEKMWWDDTANPRKFKNEVVNQLMSSRSMLVTIPSDLPWKMRLIGKISEELYSEAHNLVILENNADPETGLLSRYFPESVRILYRPPYSLGRFMAEQDKTVLHTKDIFILLTDGTIQEKWIYVIREYLKYRKKQDTAARFLIFSETKPNSTSSSFLEKLNYGDYVKSFDAESFASALAASSSVQEWTMPYLSKLLCFLSDRKPEVMAELSSQAEKLLHDPASCKELLLDQKLDLTDSDIEQRIWKAQVQTIFPALEELRSRIISKYYTDLQLALSKNDFHDRLTGEAITSPQDLELGHITALTGMSDTFILAKADLDLVYKAKEARDSLAHLKPLEWDEIPVLQEKEVRAGNF